MTTRLGIKPGGTYYRRGSWNAWCQKCGLKFKAEDVHEQWDGLKVCYKCHDDRHPQDLIRGVADQQAVAWASPEQPDIFVLDADTQGLTTVAFSAGTTDVFDDVNTLSVRIVGDLLVSVTEADVYAGANMCAVQGTDGTWEVLQFTYATLTSPMVYTLSHLLRARVGTSAAMSTTLPANSPFAFIGQSSASAYAWMYLYLGITVDPYAPVQTSGWILDSGSWNDNAPWNDAATWVG
jgi:hypothetical protein